MSSVILALPDVDEARQLADELAKHQVQVIFYAGSGNELIEQYRQICPDGVIMPQEIGNVPAEIILARLVAVQGDKPPAAVVLAYRDPLPLRTKVTSVAPGWAEVAFAGGRSRSETAAEVATVLSRLISSLEEQQREALGRLAVSGPTAAVPTSTLRRRIHIFAGVRDGVGVSSLVANVAAAASAQGRRVAVVDGDLSTGGQVGVLFRLYDNEADQHNLYRLRSLLSDGGPDKEQELVNQLTPVYPLGSQRIPVQVLLLPPRLEQLAALHPDHVVRAAQWLLESGQFDAVLVDVGGGLGNPRTAAITATASDLYVVSTPYPVDLHLLRRVEEGAPSICRNGRPMVVFSRAGAAHAASMASVLRSTALPLIATLPDTPELPADTFASRLTVLHRPEHPYSEAVASLMSKVGIGGSDQTPAARRRFPFPWRRR